ncbi:MAG: hypothetical protein HY280_03540 [Nitrospinae bacterium]|nr:hypothetical protein [Nitrospinota bacterium]
MRVAKSRLFVLITAFAAIYGFTLSRMSYAAELDANTKKIVRDDAEDAFSKMNPKAKPKAAVVTPTPAPVVAEPAPAPKPEPA